MGTLYIVSTPIGNLEDITQRALRVLSEVDLIAAEDTRVTRKLLSHYGIKTRLQSCHEHNERVQAPRLLERLQSGENIALVCDAGTPTVSDPGFLLVRLCREAGAHIEPIPGPNAAIAALSASGLPTDQFYYAGFPPQKGGKRRRYFEALKDLAATLIFYESPYRIARTLEELEEILGDRSCCLAREISKRYEEFVSGHLSELAIRYRSKAPKGELVLIVSGVRKGTLASTG